MTEPMRKEYARLRRRPFLTPVWLTALGGLLALVLLASCRGSDTEIGEVVVRKLGRLLGIFVATVLYFTMVQHLTNLYAAEHIGVERFILLDGGIYTNISSANWGNTLSQLGAVTFGYRTQFFLSRPADPKTIQVKVDGRSVPQSSSSGWVYDTSNNSVNFAKSAVPGAGKVIEITYQALCLPPP